MKNASSRECETRRVTGETNSPDTHSPLPTFTIRGLTRVDYGSKVAVFIVRFDHLELDAELYVPTDREPFVATGSVRDKYLGQYRRTAYWSDALRAAVLEEALAIWGAS